MTHLEMLAAAIEKHEGWYLGSQSWRNDNPGNLRSSPFQSGQSNGFAEFSCYATGWLALWWDLLCKCEGRTKTELGPTSTLEDLFNVWAPVSDGNNPTAYAIDVANYCGVPVTRQLSWFTSDL